MEELLCYYGGDAVCGAAQKKLQLHIHNPSTVVSNCLENV